MVCKIHKLLSAEKNLSSCRGNACGDVHNGGMYYIHKSLGKTIMRKILD